MTRMTGRRQVTHPGTSTLKMLLLASAAAGLMASSALAQDAPPPAPAEPGQVDEVVVTGVRGTQRTSIETKRTQSVIADTLVADEIGAMPDQSVGESLERITGVSADRFKGSASEVSVRGLGPYLGSSTLNGREVSSGGGDRTVSFQQFPSELVNGVLVYKTQQADFLEGGVSGVIELRTLRPLESKERLQLELRGQYNPYDRKIQGHDGWGFRGSGSLVRRWETPIGDFGLAFGYAKTDGSQPEDYYTASSSYRPCNTINTTPTALSGGLAGANCSYSAISGQPVYFVANQYTFRQMATSDEREGFMGALQWRPNEMWDFNLDAQWSKRESIEDRHDLNLAEGRRGIDPLQIAPNGALLRYAANGFLENVSTYRVREETYKGLGLTVSRSTERLTLTADFSYSDTHRNQVDRSTRLRSNTLFGASGRVAYTFDQTGDTPVVNFVLPTINLDNYGAYTTNGYARRGMEDRTDTIVAGRFDALLKVDLGPIVSLKVGLRYSDHHRVADLDNNNDIDPVTGAVLITANTTCRVPFQETGWMGDADTNIHSWAAFDARCMYKAFTGSDDLGPAADNRSSSDIDVRERITAGYAMANFESQLGSLPVRGNFGLRVVRTQVDSKGWRGSYHATTVGGLIVLTPVAGTFNPVEIKNEFTDVLPSVNVTFELKPDLLLRGAVYKAVARPNIEDMGAGRDLVPDANGVNVPDAIAGVSGGNPRLEPLQAWNMDLSLEWYPNKDTILSLAVYRKQLHAGTVPAYSGSLIEPVVIDGISYDVPVAQQTNSDRTSNLTGFEVTFQHAFTELPGLLGGFGVQGSYNYAESDFEYDDPSAVDPANPLRNFTDPAGIIGLSRHTANGTLYWEKDGLSLRLGYKYRSGYFKPSGLTALRTVDGAGFLDFSGSYDLSRHVQVKVQALNITNQRQLMFRPVEGSIAEASYYGSSFLVGLRLRF